MHIAVRIALAYAVSLAASGAVQQALLLLPDAHWLDRAFIPLAVLLLPITAAFAIVISLSTSARALARTAIVSIVVMLALAVGFYILATLNVTPGVGGNVMVAAAVLFDLFFLLPALVAPPIHWWVLRGNVRPH